MRLRTILALGAAFALLLGACGGPAAQPTATPASPGVQPTASPTAAALSGEVRVSGWSSSPAEDKLVTDAIDAFMKQNPNVKVKWEPIARDYETVLKTNLAAGTEADVFYVDIFWAESVMRAGRLRALDDLMAKTNTKKEDFALVDAFSYQGKVYGLPKDWNALGLVYSKDLFQKFGVTEPTNDWTWSELKDAAKALTRDGVLGLSLPADAARFVPFLWQAGGDLKSINDAKGVEATDFYTGFQAKEGTSKTPKELGMEWPGEALAKGRIAMAFEGGWLPSYLNKDFPNVKYGVVQMPKGPSTKANLAFTVSWSMSTKTKNPDAAWALMQHLTGPENQRTVLKAGFALPSRVTIATEITDPNTRALFDARSYVRPYNYGAPNTGKINDEINKTLESIILKKTTVQDGLDKLATTLKPLLP
jgi:multiple sugar transport system substrate-binding protein